MLLFTFQQLFSCVQNLDRKFPASSSIDLNSAGQNNMRGSTGVYNDVFVSKDPQAKKKDCSTSLQPTVVPFSSGFVCCFLSSYGRLISCRSFFFFLLLLLFFFYYSEGVFQLLPQRLFHVSQHRHNWAFNHHLSHGKLQSARVSGQQVSTDC